MTVALLAIGSLAALPPFAAATPPTAATAQAQQSPGGFRFVTVPRIAKVSCVRLCASSKRLQGGSTVVIRGRSLSSVTVATFHGSSTPDDDVTAPAKLAGTSRVKVRVPPEAVSGPVSVRTAAEVASPPTSPIDILPPLPAEALTRNSHVFPVRGRHDFGGRGAGFGSGRAGHSHQGHDVFARCGTPLVAARGGRVQFRTYHPAGGHYIVIDGAGTGTDYAYMHLESRSPFKVGDRVRTGQRIGSVGDSGNARGCHLHFEMWTAPGWYQGGRAIDPLRALKAWDSWS